jgi:tRNA threonylcarbamoyladenosine biosynthesis protein TsaE
MISTSGRQQWWTGGRTVGPAGTRSLAAALARISRPGDVVLLVGGLGAGKTTFAQGFAEGLGVTGPVTSPTFTLVRQYRCNAWGIRYLLHADLYRLDSLVEVADLGLAEQVEGDAVALVEWGDAAPEALGESALTVELGFDPGDKAVSTSPATAARDAGPVDEVRLVRVGGRGPDWSDRHDAVRSVLARFAVDTAAGAAR